jgi:Peptidase family M28
MRISRSLAALAACLCLSAALTAADEQAVNPKISKIADEVSEARIKAIIEKLVSFGTRNTMSTQDDPNRGVGAARQWVFNEMKSYSPRLQVSFDKYRVKKQGQRIFKDVDLWNVVAVLPGTKYPETQVLVTGHYDSLNFGSRPTSGTLQATSQMTPADFERDADLPAPGACDDASGTAAVMELARVMSQYEFDKTLVFISFAGEEQGLIGSSLMSAKARKEGRIIEAVLNNDIIGTDTAGNGRFSNDSVEVYSGEEIDSPSQQLARYMRDVVERYIPSMRVDTVFMQDRLGRGGDQTPFHLEGYAAVRISTPNEIYANQHRATDLLENMSVPYTTKVARVNAVTAASLALAPKPPEIMRIPGAGRAGASAATPAVRRPVPMISRGSGYDAVLNWKPAGPDDHIKGYAVVIRSTTSPYWEREIYVGNVDQYTLKDVSIDDVKFGVKAIGLDGAESLVSVYTYPPRAKAEIQTVDR